MSHSASEVDVFNRALIKLKQKTIVSLDDPTSTFGDIAAQVLADQRRSLLREGGIWNFAKTRANLTRLAEDAPENPAFDYNAAFQLPTNYVRMVYVGYEKDRYFYRQRWDVVGNVVFYNTEDNSIPVTYVRDEPIVAKWDPLFLECVAYKVAMELCIYTNGSKGLLEQLTGNYEKQLGTAMNLDALENPPIFIDLDKSTIAHGNPFGGGLPSNYWDFDS